MSKFTRILTFVAVLAIFFAACTNENKVTPTTDKLVKEFDSQVPQSWNNLFLEIERYAAVYRPCPASRALGYIGLAVYEANVWGMPEYQSVANRYQGLTIPQPEAGKLLYAPAVTNAVYAALYKKFFANVKSEDLFKVASLESSFNTEFGRAVSSDVLSRSKAYGQSVAEAVWAYSATDPEGHEKYTNPRPNTYTPPVGVGKWKATPPGNQAAMYPYWGKVRTFAIKEADKLGKPPIPYSEDRTSLYYAQGLEVYSSTTPQTAEFRWIAEFWSDDVLNFTFSPASRWLAIGNQALSIEKSNLEKAILMQVKLGFALNDAAVSAWYSKYYYNIERPVTYIQKVIDPNWNITGLTTNGFLGSTPSFPAYPSGHSTFGGAAAEVLSNIFGADFAMTDRCHEGRTDFDGSRPRAFSSFYDMAQENAYSRIYLGVHWRMDCEEGVRMGSVAGRRVNALPFKK